jgi:hypothetical protein
MSIDNIANGLVVVCGVLGACAVIYDLFWPKGGKQP